MKSPSWQNQKKKQVFDKYGVPGFLSKECFNNSYNKYIEHLAARLNEFVAGIINPFIHIREVFLTDICRHC